MSSLKLEKIATDNCLPEVVCSSEDLLLMPQLLPLHSIEHVAEELSNFQEEVKSCLDVICKWVMQSNPAPVISTASSASNVT